MREPMSVEDMSLLVRALHRDVTDLDERLRKLQATVRELRIDQDALDLRVVEVP